MNYYVRFRVRSFLLGLGVVGLMSCSRPFYIEQKPITFNDIRRALTIDYLKTHYAIEQSTPAINPRMIVVHWTAVPTFDATFEVFDPPTLRNTRADLEGAGELNVSAHYLVDRDGHIAQLLPDTVMARHVIGLNHVAIGIENVGSADAPLTDGQLKANAWLIRRLGKMYPIEYVIGHYEYRLFEGHPLWRETDPDYRTYKTDPGVLFMMRLRDRLDDLNLAPIPSQTGAMTQ